MDHQPIDLDSLTPGARTILDIASQLFSEQGIHSVGVDTIAAEARVTKPILYKNFGNKDGLIAAYLQNRHQCWWPELEAAIGKADSPRALALFDVYMQDAKTITRGCAYLNAAAELPADHPAYPMIRRHKHAVCERLRELIEEDLPETPNVQRLADHLFLLAEGAFAHHRIYGGSLLSEAREIAAGLLSS